MVGRQRKKKKMAKRPQAVPKILKFGPKYKLNNIFVFLFWKILFWVYNFFIFVHKFRWKRSEFFYTRFSSGKSESQQRLEKKITHFTIQFRSKNLTHFTNFKSFDRENNMLPQYSQKPFSFCKVSSKRVSAWFQKKDCTARFLDPQEVHS